MKAYNLLLKYKLFMYARCARSMEQNGGIRFLWHGVGPYAKSRKMTSQANLRVLNQSLPPSIAYQYTTDCV